MNKPTPYPYLDVKGHIELLYNKIDNLTVKNDNLEDEINHINNNIELLSLNNSIGPYKKAKKQLRDSENNELRVDFSDLGRVLTNMVDEYSTKYNINKTPNNPIIVDTNNHTIRTYNMNESEYKALGIVLNILGEIDINLDKHNISKIRELMDDNILVKNFETLCKFAFKSKGA